MKTLNPFLDSFLEQHSELPEYIVADAGYGSYHKENKKKYKNNNPFNVENWRYLEEQDESICPAKRPVPFKRYNRRKDKGGFVRDFKIYECENCWARPVRRQCTKAKSDRNRQILVNNSWRYFKAEGKKKLLDEKQVRFMENAKLMSNQSLVI